MIHFRKLKRDCPTVPCLIHLRSSVDVRRNFIELPCLSPSCHVLSWSPDTGAGAHPAPESRRRQQRRGQTCASFTRWKEETGDATRTNSARRQLSCSVESCKHTHIHTLLHLYVENVHVGFPPFFKPVTFILKHPPKYCFTLEMHLFFLFM